MVRLTAQCPGEMSFLMRNVAGTGMVTKTTLDNTTTAKITAMVNAITVQAKSVVRDLDPVNDLKFLRMRSNRTEILIAPGRCVS